MVHRFTPVIFIIESRPSPMKLPRPLVLRHSSPVKLHGPLVISPPSLSGCMVHSFSATAKLGRWTLSLTLRKWKHISNTSFHHCILQLFPMSSAYWSEINFRKPSTSDRSCWTLSIFDFTVSTSSDVSLLSLSSSSIEVAGEQWKKVSEPWVWYWVFLDVSSLSCPKLNSFSYKFQASLE